MMQTTIDWNELVAEVTSDVRAGVAVDAAVAEAAAYYDANPSALRARFDKAWPNGLMAAPPSEAEMLARHDAASQSERAAAARELSLIAEFFGADSALRLLVG